MKRGPMSFTSRTNFTRDCQADRGHFFFLVVGIRFFFSSSTHSHTFFPLRSPSTPRFNCGISETVEFNNLGGDQLWKSRNVRVDKVISRFIFLLVRFAASPFPVSNGGDCVECLRSNDRGQCEHPYDLTMY